MSILYRISNKMSENLYKNIQTSNKNLLKLIEYSKKLSTTNVIK